MESSTQKITAHIPKALLRAAQESTGMGITETVKAGLKILAAQKAFEDLRLMRAKVRLNIDIAELRKDRDER